MPRLEDRLQEMNESLKGQVPDDALEVMGGHTQELVDEGRADEALGVGDRAPDFSLPATDGGKVGLGDLRAQGPVVLSFYRGRW